MKKEKHEIEFCLFVCFSICAIGRVSDGTSIWVSMFVYCLREKLVDGESDLWRSRNG